MTILDCYLIVIGAFASVMLCVAASIIGANLIAEWRKKESQ